MRRLFLTMLWCALLVSQAQADCAVRPAEVVLQVGETRPIPLMVLAHNAGLRAGTVDVLFNPSLLTFESLGEMEGACRARVVKPGRLRIVCERIHEGATFLWAHTRLVGMYFTARERALPGTLEATHLTGDLADCEPYASRYQIVR